MTPAEYNQCVDTHADGLFRFILKNMRDEEEARDVVQDAFEKCGGIMKRWKAVKPRVICLRQAIIL